MLDLLPVCCCPRAFEALLKLRGGINDDMSLIPAAVAISMYSIKDASLEYCEGVIDSYRSTILSHVHGGQMQATLAHLHSFLFEDEEFSIFCQAEVSPEDMYLPLTFKRRKASPALMAVVYAVIASRLGIEAYVTAYPGASIVRIKDREFMYIDVSRQGRFLTADDLKEEFSWPDTEESEMGWKDDFLEPIINRCVVTSILKELLNVFLRNMEYMNVAAVLETEALLWPQHVTLWKDLGLTYSRCGFFGPARQCIEYYLSRRPDDLQVDDLKEILERMI